MSKDRPAGEKVAERVADYPDLPVIGWGHRSAGWDRDVTVSELDAVSGETPVVLISGDGHHAWLNTVALLFLAMPVRDSVVREAEWFAAYPRLASLVGNDGEDQLFGNDGHDILNGVEDPDPAEPDKLDGGDGRNLCFVDALDDPSDCKF